MVVQQGAGVPKMTANPPAIRRARGGAGETTWLLPLWREVPRKVRRPFAYRPSSSTPWICVDRTSAHPPRRLRG